MKRSFMAAEGERSPGIEPPRSVRLTVVLASRPGRRAAKGRAVLGTLSLALLLTAPPLGSGVSAPRFRWGRAGGEPSCARASTLRSRRGWGVSPREGLVGTYQGEQKLLEPLPEHGHGLP